MAKVGLVGHCGPDSSYLQMAVRSVDRGVSVALADDDAGLQKLVGEGVELLLINRVLDFGFDCNEGVEIIRRLRQHDPALKMMLVSNYPEAQAAAVAAGALSGFGKREIGSPKVKELLREALELPKSASK